MLGLAYDRVILDGRADRVSVVPSAALTFERGRAWWFSHDLSEFETAILCRFDNFAVGGNYEPSTGEPVFAAAQTVGHKKPGAAFEPRK